MDQKATKGLTAPEMEGDQTALGKPVTSAVFPKAKSF
jgi:hypothetical protein